MVPTLVEAIEVYSSSMLLSLLSLLLLIFPCSWDEVELSVSPYIAESLVKNPVNKLDEVEDSEDSDKV